MQDELKQIGNLALFAKIVQAGGISRCAKEIGLERTTVSRRIGELEQAMGVKLLDRTPRQIILTEAGRRCLMQCEQLLETSRNAFSLAATGEPIQKTQSLILGAPPDLIAWYLDDLLSQFEDEHQGLRVERRPVSNWIPGTIESIDLGLSLTPPPASDIWAVSVGKVCQSIYASVAYVSRNDPIRTPFDLSSHPSIVEEPDANRTAWRFDQNGKAITVPVNARYKVPGLLEAREATLAGLGVSCLPKYLCEPYLVSGQLIDLVPNYLSDGRDVIAITSRQRPQKNKLTALRVHIESAFCKTASSDPH